MRRPSGRRSHRARRQRSAGGGRRRLDRIAEWPVAPALRSTAGDRLGIKAQARVRTQNNATIAGPRSRGADNRLAETDVVPADDRAAVGIVHIDDDVAAALGGGEFCLAVGRGAEPSPPGGTAGRQRKCRSAVARSRPLT